MAQAEKADTDNVRVGIEEVQLDSEPPYFRSPYPSQLTQVHVGETRGEREVIQLINDHWPASIDDLEELSEELFDDGYSGSFIRYVLRHNYVPEDLMTDGSSPRDEDEDEHEDEDREAVVDQVQGVVEDDVEVPEETWHLIFRWGIRAALENGIDAEEAFGAFESGFIEGQKLKAEMDWEE